MFTGEESAFNTSTTLGNNNNKKKKKEPLWIRFDWYQGINLLDSSAKEPANTACDSRDFAASLQLREIRLQILQYMILILCLPMMVLWMVFFFCPG